MAEKKKKKEETFAMVELSLLCSEKAGGMKGPVVSGQKSLFVLHFAQELQKKEKERGKMAEAKEKMQSWQVKRVALREAFEEDEWAASEQMKGKKKEESQRKMQLKKKQTETKQKQKKAMLVAELAVEAAFAWETAAVVQQTASAHQNPRFLL